MTLASRNKQRREADAVATWTPELRFMQLAENRTRGMRNAWAAWGDYSLKMLCASCYLQGIEDAYNAEQNAKAVKIHNRRNGVDWEQKGVWL